MTRFALIGAAGFVAPRHMKAIRDVGGTLVAACDVHDSVGILDSLAPDCAFFTEIERFDRHLELLRREGEGVDYIAVCSPNYLHDAHCRLALRLGASAICEKPLVISPWNLDQLAQIETENDRRIYTVLQLRQHPITEQLRASTEDGYNHVELRYITTRGPWYHHSWKGRSELSGGLIMNIGVHFLDLLLHVFGSCQEMELKKKTAETIEGELALDRAYVDFKLSIDGAELPEGTPGPYRSLIVNGQEFRFDGGFADLHTKIYEQVLAGKGSGIEEARAAIELAYWIEATPIIPT